MTGKADVARSKQTDAIPQSKTAAKKDDPAKKVRGKSNKRSTKTQFDEEGCVCHLTTGAAFCSLHDKQTRSSRPDAAAAAASTTKRTTTASIASNPSKSPLSNQT